MANEISGEAFEAATNIISEALFEIGDHLRGIRSSLEKLSDGKGCDEGLGPCDSPGRIIVYCNTKGPDGWWYTLNSERKPETFPKPCILAYVKKIEFPQLERRGEMISKMQATLQADKTYVLECGASANFAKGFMSAMSLLSVETLKKPIYIQAKPSGEEESILFCSVWADGDLVLGDWDRNTNFRPIAIKAVENVNAANDNDGR